MQSINAGTLLESVAAGKSPHKRTASAQTAIEIRGIGVLVVDDNDDLRSCICETVRRLGYEVVEAGDSSAALALLEGPAGDKVDVVLSDLNLPDLSGNALARLVEERWADRKVLLMSGETDAAAGEPWRFLRKPFRRADLAQALSDVLGSAR